MTKNMTTGSPMKHILGFTVPLVFGFLFQQFYSLMDTVIVGRFLGTDNLAAVGATGSINFLIIGFCMGVCSGFAIPIAHKFGADDYEGMRRYVANSVWMAIMFAVAVTALTTGLCRQILVWMRTPENIIENSYAYIWVIFLGIPVTFLYNMTSGVIRALGDSKTPVVFLVLASFLNIGLDLFFIIRLNLGVQGAAWATVISQGVSGVCCLLFLIKKFEILRIRKGEWTFDPHMMRVLCGMGVPMGLQYSITAIGSVILQSATNTLGSDAVAAVTASGRINGFLACPLDALGSTMATYGGQNVGAGKLDRVSQGLKSSVLLGTGYALIALFISTLFGRNLATLFLDVSETAIIDNAQMLIIVNTSFYFPLALIYVIRFLIQGAGFPTLAVVAGVFEMVARAAVGFILVPILGLTGVAMGNPTAWILADVFLIPAYFHVRKVLAEKLKRESGSSLAVTGLELTVQH